MYFFRRRRPESARNLTESTLRFVSGETQRCSPEQVEFGGTVLAAAKRFESLPAERDSELNYKVEGFSLAQLTADERFMMVDYLTGDRKKLATELKISEDDLKRRVIEIVRELHPRVYGIGGSGDT